MCVCLIAVPLGIFHRSRNCYRICGQQSSCFGDPTAVSELRVQLPRYSPSRDVPSPPPNHALFFCVSDAITHPQEPYPLRKSYVTTVLHLPNCSPHLASTSAKTKPQRVRAHGYRTIPIHPTSPSSILNYATHINQRRKTARASEMLKCKKSHG
jgi:hypothetical protein